MGSSVHRSDPSLFARLPSEPKLAVTEQPNAALSATVMRQW